jgi:Spy/CpxP family protein refolding chaperone
MLSILQINTEFFTKQDQLVKSDENKDALKSLRKERHQKEVKVLTPEQIEKLKAYQAQQKAKSK